MTHTTLIGEYQCPICEATMPDSLQPSHDDLHEQNNPTVRSSRLTRDDKALLFWMGCALVGAIAGAAATNFI